MTLQKSISKMIYIHGVQAGDNKSAIEGPTRMEKSVRNLIKELPEEFKFDYDQAMPAYEDINDNGTGSKVRNISRLIFQSMANPLAAAAFDGFMDLVGDVFIYQYSNDAEKIREVVNRDIGSNNNCVLAAHSLGSVIAFDIINERMKSGEFKDKHVDEWPIRSLVTFGSPLRLKLFRESRHISHHHGKKDSVFHWFNYLDRDDPIVSGNVFGQGITSDDPMSDCYPEAEDRGWHIHDRPINTGAHLYSHINYWEKEKISRRVMDQVYRGVKS